MPTSLRHRLRFARRSIIYLLVIALACVAAMVGVVGQLLPWAERNPDKVAAWLSERAGRPVQFEGMQTQWTRRGPLLRFDGLHIGDVPDGVSVGRAEVLVAMYSGFLPGHTFTELRLRELSLTLLRNQEGIWSVQGLPVQQRVETDPLDYLEGLGELQIIDGRLAVQAPDLGLDVV
ncbi:MAG: hypothetical protein LBV45_11320, partial [Xanthomonadaceae bacterium]|nr:hypothetical protein [Xanthomonadaceae bacterium]